MTVTISTTTFEPDAEAAPTPVTLDTAPPVDEVRSDLAWLLAQAWVSAPLFA
jgi:hypothetical protein